MNNPYALLFLATGIGIIAGLIAGIIATQAVAETALGMLPIAGIVFGVVALVQGLVGAIFMKRATDTKRVPFRLMVTGAIETIATLTVVFTLIQTTNP